jgi:hypothetical protein
MDDRLTCPRPEALAAFAGGRLSSTEARGVEVHVGQCAACAAALPKPLVHSGPTLYLGPPPHGIFMHASPRGLTCVSYKLDQPFAKFVADVSLNDTCPESPLPLVFAVYGDDRLLWKSKEVQTQGDRQSCSVDVSGVKMLKLAVHTDGDERGAHGAWIEPRLLRQ